MNTTTQNITTGVFHSKPDLKPVKTNSNNTASRPDWLLYSVPVSAFVIGIVLFTTICKTQRQRNGNRQHTATAKKRPQTNGNAVTVNNFGSSTQRYMEKPQNNKKDETQSYENVEAAIYNNQDKITFYVSPDEDYLNPDATGEEEMMRTEEQLNTLQLPSNLTDTDGESYENMEGCVYAQPRKRTQRIQNTTEDEDYINPDDDGNPIMDHTDTESYEIMSGSDCIYNNSGFTAVHDLEDGDSYEVMDEVPI
ncbi:uncharacterized protein isoform X1 [Danio rerio]|uniref:Uncharacterized protein isoform X1 n=1 Tax=Danio rerio TaxID=7955 RepID=A0AC58J1D5_DANRE